MSSYRKVRARYKKPLTVFICILISLFTINLSTIHFLYGLDIFLPWGVELIDATVLTFLIFPVVYFFLFRPLVITVGDLEQVEAELRRAQANLEERVKARTLELAEANQALQKEINDHKVTEKALQDSLAKLRKTMGGIIQAITLTVEARDPYTAGHQRRVSDLARSIANEMGLELPQVDGARMAGIVHDLGKISIPIEILKKPGPLSKEEFDLIKTHTQVAYDILKNIDFPWPLAQIVLQHHERMNGSGYPFNLKSKDILIEAKVLAVADVVEAMTSYRHYRKPPGLDKALEEIATNKGILYDEEVVNACVKLFKERGYKL